MSEKTPDGGGVPGLRKRAERAVESDAAARAPATSSPDRLVHELQVHQAELEIQTEELIRSRLALEESERRWRSIFDSAPIAYVVVGDDGLVLEANGAAVHLLGRSEPLLGKAVSRLAVDEDQIPLHRLVTRVFAARSSQRLELHVRQAGGASRPVEVVAGLLDGPEGRRALVMLEDLTGRRLAEEERSRLASQVERLQRLDALGRMAGAVAHEINNVLAIILASADEAEAGLGGPGTAEAVHEVARAARRGRELTQRLLGFSRVTPRERVPCDVASIVREAATFLRRLAGGMVEVREELAETPLTAVGDAMQIHQALLNLGLNAIDAVGKRGGTITLRVEGETVHPGDGPSPHRAAAGEYVRISVIDDGPGFDPAALQHAFEPFFTTKPAGKGTGLGLAMVWGIARDHGGFATLDSRPGAGARVALVLPRTTLPIAAAPASVAPKAVPGGLVLVVDDEPALRRSLMKTLQRAGFTAEGAPDGRAALEWLAARGGDVRMVLLDVQMPGMSGLDVLGELRASFPRLPVVLMSGYSEEKVPDEFLADGATVFLGKPFEPGELVAVTRRVAGDGGEPAGRC